MNKYKAMKNTPAKWDKVMNMLLAKDPGKGSLLLNGKPSAWCVPVDEDVPAALVLVFPAGSKFAIKMLDRIEVAGYVTAVMHEVFDCTDITFTCIESNK